MKKKVNITKKELSRKVNSNLSNILPNACVTCIEVKMNFRTLIHFMNERLCTRAQWEIRQMALLMKKAIEEQYQKFKAR